MLATFRQAPPRNASVVGSQVFSHNGEFAPQVVDFVLPCRGIAFEFVRKYHSAHTQEIGQLGRGWTFTYARQIEREGADILYRDGNGNTHRFTPIQGQGSYSSPEFYATLTLAENTFLLRERYGTVFTFNTPEDGGRLFSITDRNNNSLSFEYAPDTLRVRDPFGRTVTILYDAGCVTQVQDHKGRIWRYGYNQERCLIEVIQPPNDQFPGGLRTAYGYDDQFRLISITDPKGQTFLTNVYDYQGRVVCQLHGDGTYEFQYEDLSPASPDLTVYRTTVIQKNRAQLLIEHDAAGHAIKRTLQVSAEALSPEDRGNTTEANVPVITTANFNRFGELVEQVSPAGSTTFWTYSDDQPDPLACGNLLQVRQQPAPGVESDQNEIITTYTYEPVFQRRSSITDPRVSTIRFTYDERGNLTQKIYPEVTIQRVNPAGVGGRSTEMRQHAEYFEYNKAGQLIRTSDTRGAVTRYYYYPFNDPGGTRGKGEVHSDVDGIGGYLAQVVNDPTSEDRRLEGKPAHLVKEFGYDPYGNISTVWDGKGNSTRFTYDALGRLVSVKEREPFNYEIGFRYDANGNPVEATGTFDRYQYNPGSGGIDQLSSPLRQQIEYNTLNNITRISTLTEGREIVETVERDASEDIVRKIQPLGNVTSYRFDERHLLLERRFSEGTTDETIERFTYTPNGRRRSLSDERGVLVHYHYDGFHRYRGFTNADGTTKWQRFDEADNITHIEVRGNVGEVNERGEPADSREAILLENRYHFDELNRCFRTDRSYRDTITGKQMGRSQWDGREGIVSAVIEYADNHLPAKLWFETGNIISLTYDGADQLTGVVDATGEETAQVYDENGNLIHRRRLGPVPESGEERFEERVDLRYDPLDRLIERSTNLEPPEILTYNSLGFVTSYTDQAGATTTYLHDAMGRPVGEVAIAKTEGGEQQTLVQHFELDENNRIVAGIDASGQQTRYLYDTLNRRSGVVYPDGTSKSFKRDGVGNIIEITDQNGNHILQRFDTLDRLVERRIEPANGEEAQSERFHYDGLNRLVAVLTDGAPILRRYDSLSRILEENQAGVALRYSYDAAGNQTRLLYPDGQEVHKLYDSLRRVTEVRDGADELITKYQYRSSGQLKRQQIADILETTFAYKECQGCLSEIAYRSLRDNRLISGSRYLYNVEGFRTHEIQLDQGEQVGERYFYDSANRLTRVQYGVADVNDPNSTFEREVQYDLTPVGGWQRKRVLDAQGQVLAQLDGVTNQRHAYLSLGQSSFEYDANGNCIQQSGGIGDDSEISITNGATPPPRNDDSASCAVKQLSYDYANRLVKIVCLDELQNPTKTIEYSYDAFGRQTRKRVTDASSTKEYKRVWSGRQLIAEYEDGILSRSFIYSDASEQPVKMTVHAAGQNRHYYYTVNGRGQVIALVDQEGQAVERYSYTAYGKPFLKELNGQRVEEVISSSPNGNPFLSGGHVWDVDAGMHFGIGTAYHPGKGQVSNPEGKLGGPGCGNSYSPGSTDPRADDASADGGTGGGKGWSVSLGGVTVNVGGGKWVDVTINNNGGCIALVCVGNNTGNSPGGGNQGDAGTPGGSGGGSDGGSGKGGGKDGGSGKSGKGGKGGKCGGGGGSSGGGDSGSGGGSGGGDGGSSGGGGGKPDGGTTQFEDDGGQNGDDGCGGDTGGTDPQSFTSGDGDDTGGRGRPLSIGGLGVASVGSGCSGIGSMVGKYTSASVLLGSLKGVSVGGCSGGIGSLGGFGGNGGSKCGNTGILNDTFGGINPGRLDGRGGPTPMPMDNMGAMGAGGGGGYIPGGGYSDPPRDQWGVGVGTLDPGSVSVYAPRGSGYTDPGPESTGGTCGTGMSGGGKGFTPPECSRY